LEVVRRLPQVSDAAVFGAGLHVSARNPAGAQAAIKEALTQEGISLRRLEAVHPSLEDAFISLIQEATENQGPVARD
jgi:ABC-2 type transport system ATP-binding protein